MADGMPPPPVIEPAALPAVRPLPEQIASAIVLMIAGGTLLPGQRLVETELASRLQTSRAPLREAMRRLEAQGILSTTPYRGTRVVSFDPQSEAQIIEARIALERLVIRGAAAAVRETPRRARALDDVLVEMGRCVAARDRLGLNRADVAFHRAMCRIADNPVLLALWEAIAGHVLISFGLSNARYPDSDAVLEQHVRLRTALVAAETDALEGIAERHVLGQDLPSNKSSKTKGRTQQCAAERFSPPSPRSSP